MQNEFFFEFSIGSNRIIRVYICGKPYAWVGSQRGRLYGIIPERRLKGLYLYLKKYFEEKENK
jgi:hypothetical protein